MDITSLVQAQRDYFKTKATYDVEFRLRGLRKLQEVIKTREQDIEAALKTDLGKSGFESYMTEIGMVYEELTYMISHVKRLSKDKFVWTPLVHFPAISFRRPSPFGNVLIMSPWNYPFLLALGPTIDALAAGNTVVLKPGSYAPATSNIIKQIIEKAFAPEYVSVVLGGREENQALLDQKFDYIFFTGSTEVGRTVMEKASKNLTPVSLELGGKSPVIVDLTSDLKMAARRVVFGKFINCGQTCIAPDYLIVHKLIKNQFIALLIEEIKKQYGAKPLENPDYGKIINEKHYQRLLGLLKNETLAFGGSHNNLKLQIEPAILSEATMESPAMKEEIFGPLLPVLTYETTEDIFKIVEAHPTPLALYLFTKDKVAENDILTHISFGGGCVNETLMHIATTHMPFGGVGTSGIGSYHGQVGFDTFTHYKSLLRKANHPDLVIRYQPYTRFKSKLLRMFLK